MTEEQARASLGIIIGAIEHEIQAIKPSNETLTREERERFDDGGKLSVPLGAKAIRDTEFQFLKSLEFNLMLYKDAKRRRQRDLESLWLFQLGEYYGRLHAYRVAISDSHSAILASLQSSVHRESRISDGNSNDRDIVRREARKAIEGKVHPSINGIALRICKSWKELGLSREFSPRTITRWIKESLTLP